MSAHRSLPRQVVDLKSTFGARVKSQRMAAGMTQEELAQQVGVDYKHIGAIERGLRAPSFDVIERIAKVLKVTPYQLFLPADKKQIQIENEIRVVLLELAKSKRTAIRTFLEATLRAAKKIDR